MVRDGGQCPVLGHSLGGDGGVQRFFAVNRIGFAGMLLMYGRRGSLEGWRPAPIIDYAGVPAVFALDSRLEQDTLTIGDFPLSRLLLSNDSNYPWFILVPRRADISELFQLEAADQQQLWQETTLLAETLKDSFDADKLNVATLGNVVSQLHMHVIVRKREDAAWPAPVWGKHPARPYTAEQVAAIRERLRLVLSDGFTFLEG